MLITTFFIRALRWLAILTTALGAAGCGIITTLAASANSPDDPSIAVGTATMVITPAPIRVSTTKSASDFGLMALFAELSYLRFIPESERNDSNCRRHIARHPIASIAGDSPGPHWQRWDHELGCTSESGLYFEIYVYGTANNIQRAVIAFRGTENNGMQTPLDWSSNFSTLFGLDPREYRLAREKVAPALKALRQLNGQVEIHVTGHSLGGGIAQQIAYTQEEISEAFVFNSSPVTNWSYLSLYHPEKIVRRDPVIHRIQERGEALAAVRWLTSRVNTRRFNRSDYEFDFASSSLSASHSMAIIACNLALLVYTHSDAKYDYTQAMSGAAFRYKDAKGTSLCPGSAWGTVDPARVQQIKAAG